MHPLYGRRWAKAGTALLWNPEVLSQIAQPDEVYSLRQFLLLSNRPAEEWPDELPSNQGQTLVVAGLDGCLDALSADDTQTWLTDILKPAILAFQDWAQGEGGLALWLPDGYRRITYSPAQETYHWRLNSPRDTVIPLAKCLWSGAAQDANHILLGDSGANADLTGKDWAGLHLEHIA